MSGTEPNAPRFYGTRVGLVAAVFSVAQALLLFGSALGGQAAIQSMQQAISVIQANGLVVDYTLLLGPLVPVLVVAYGSMLAAGLVTLWLARSAGRMSALRAGRHAGGARAGMWVWLISTLVWLAASVVVVVLTHRDGTVSGVLFGTGRPNLMGYQITFLLIQEVIAALVALGFNALAGSRGAATAALVEPAPVAVGMGQYPFAAYPPVPWMALPPQQQGYQAPAPGVYPPAAAPGYPGAMYPPPTAWAPPAAAYPPPPSHYLPQPVAPQAPAPATPDAPAGGVSPQEPGA
ncbi:MAG TPA: hypothetical protein VF808_05565 [Ktedonobacterales bacterium]